jgi:hypothetical protein
LEVKTGFRAAGVLFEVGAVFGDLGSTMSCGLFRLENSASAVARTTTLTVRRIRWLMTRETGG